MHPHLIEIGRFAVPTYGILAAIGLIVGLSLNVRLAVRAGIEEDRAWNLGVIAIFSAVLGAKLLLIFNDPEYLHPRNLFSLNMLQAGGVWYGGFIGGGIGAIAYMWWRKLPVLTTWDAFVPGIALGHAIGRVGCFAAGCCYGRPLERPWAVTFTEPAANATSGTPLNIPLHPTQLYEFAVEFCIFLLLLWMWKRRSFAGQIVGTYLFLYGIARYFLEFYRADPQRGSMFGGFMTVTQFISICLVLIGGILWMRRAPANAPPASA